MLEHLRQKKIGDMVKVEVVIPIYRAEQALVDVVENCMAIPEISRIILVWDGGTNECLNTARSLDENWDRKVLLIELTRNFGQHNAILAAIECVTAPFIVTIDEDYQHNPLSIPLLLEKILSEDVDVVYATYREARFSWHRKLLSESLRRALILAIPGLPAEYSSFRIIRTSLAKHLMRFSNSYTFIDGYLAWCTDRFSSIAVEHHNSREKKSAYTTSKLLVHALNIFVVFSVLPLRLLTLIGSFLLILTSIAGVWVVIEKFILEKDYLPGYASTAILLLGSLGILSMFLGILAEYVFRINEKTSNRPSFLIRPHD